MNAKHLVIGKKYLYTCPDIHQTMRVEYLGASLGYRNTHVFRVLRPHWLENGEYELSDSAVREHVVERVTVSANHPALDHYADRLSSMERGRLMCQMFRGDRFAVFHIDGDQVSLADVEPAIRLGPQEPPDSPMIYNRRMPDGSYRDIAGFFERA